jgi:hypothetical protein
VKRAYLIALIALAGGLMLAVVIARRERPVTATWPEPEDALPPFDPRTWPLASDNLTSASGWVWSYPAGSALGPAGLT